VYEREWREDFFFSNLHEEMLERHVFVVRRKITVLRRVLLTDFEKKSGDKQ